MQSFLNSNACRSLIFFSFSNFSSDAFAANPTSTSRASQACMQFQLSPTHPVSQTCSSRSPTILVSHWLQMEAEVHLTERPAGMVASVQLLKQRRPTLPWEGGPVQLSSLS